MLIATKAFFFLHHNNIINNPHFTLPEKHQNSDAYKYFFFNANVSHCRWFNKAHDWWWMYVSVRPMNISKIFLFLPFMYFIHTFQSAAYDLVIVCDVQKVKQSKPIIITTRWMCIDYMQSKNDLGWIKLVHVDIVKGVLFVYFRLFENALVLVDFQ